MTLHTGKWLGVTIVSGICVAGAIFFLPLSYSIRVVLAIISSAIIGAGGGYLEMITSGEEK